MKFFVSAGEASGDLHASQLMTAIKGLDPQAEFIFLGGDMMSAAAGGTEPIIHYRRMAFMGFAEVIRHLPTVLSNLSMARNALIESRPDALILVDYPSFNLKLAKTAHKAGIPVFYYISPKVWAWKEGRVKKFKRLVDRMLSILPFEPEWYKSRHDYDVTYVGNPSVNEVDAKLSVKESDADFCRRHSLDPDRPLLALVPGSRRAEVLSNLPVMVEVARRHPGLQPVIAGAPGLDDSLYESWNDIPRVSGDTFGLMAHSRGALVTSGTATLEAALIGVPQVVCYRANGSRLSYGLFKRILKIKYVSLPNLIVDAPIVAEQLLHHCNPDEVDARLTPLLADTVEAAAQRRGYADMRSRLTDADAAASAAGIIVGDLSKKSCQPQR